MSVYYPVLLKLEGKRCVVVGGGFGTTERVRSLLDAGAEVTLIAKVGRDTLGDQAIENFGREGIRTDCILRSPDDHTGVALILVDDAGENLISVASGANQWHHGCHVNSFAWVGRSQGRSKRRNRIGDKKPGRK